ncbi:HtaA domain-containing protein [Pseudolysinimonas sp.]
MRRAPLALAAALLVGLPAAPAVAQEAQPPGCDVEAATLDWGFKESFRAYIDGSIANGEWTVADGATYETPTFGFTASDGRIDPSGPNGSIEFPGSVRFTGHDGLLDTTIANPVLVLRAGGEDALLLLDVTGATMDGDAVAVEETPFVAIDLAGQDLAPVDGVLTISEAPTALTADGEIAFPNYPAGEAFDPVTITMDVGDCDLSGLPIGGDAGDPPVDGTPLVAGMVGVGVVLLAAIVGLVAFFVRRARASRASG